MPGGRPSKLTPEVQEKIVQAIKLGATYELAAGYAGISARSLSNWMKDGAEATRGQYFQLFQAIKEAEGQGALGWLAKIEKAASDGNWQAAAWKLERRYPNDYGKTVQQHNVNVQDLTDDELEDIAKS